MINWVCKYFKELTIDELYSVLHLRSEVFVVEQNCFYLDPDFKDQKSLHLLGWKNGVLIAYSRILPAGISYPEVSIGRVVVKKTERHEGLGKDLMQKSVTIIFEKFGKQTIKISAQLYLKNFYEKLGFQQSSDVYDDAGIDHIEMIKKMD